MEFWLFSTLFAMVIVVLGVHSRVLRILRDRHTEVWDELGKPSLFANNTTQNGWATNRYLWSSRPRGLGDQQLMRLIVFERVLTAICLVLFVLMFFSILASSI